MTDERVLGLEHVVIADGERTIAALLRILSQASDFGETQPLDVIMVGVPTDLGEELRGVIEEALAGHFDLRNATAPARFRAKGEELTDVPSPHWG